MLLLLGLTEGLLLLLLLFGLTVVGEVLLRVLEPVYSDRGLTLPVQSVALDTIRV